MTVRCARERAVQTIAYEIGGWLVATPAYAIAFGRPPGESLVLMIALTVAMLVWSPIHNTVFDHAEWRFCRRVASSRPHRVRICHALSHEATSVVVTLPVIMAIGGHGFWAALAADVGLTLIYAAYAYLFHLAYDRIRPIRHHAELPVIAPAPLSTLHDAIASPLAASGAAAG